MNKTSSQRKMTALFVKTAPQGRHYDKEVKGLFLLVKPTGAKSWIYRYQLNGKRYDLGLGSTRKITVAVAHKKALECKLRLAEGINPKIAKQKPEISYRFEDVANDFIEIRKPSWRNQKHISQWYNTLKTYVFPVIGCKHVQEIETSDILKILNPIWLEKTETASRIQGRIESILDYAMAHKMMKGENPARWKNHLSYMLAKPTAIKKVRHHPSMDYRDLPKFVKELVQKESIASKALLFVILTGGRSGEIRGMKWQEIDWRSKTWIIPPERMKAKKEHKVPLTEQAIRLLGEMPLTSEYVFESPCKTGHSMTSEALMEVIKRMGIENVTVHGFRSTFRNWVAEQTDTSFEVSETAISHSVGNATTKAYLRTDLLDKRRILMQEWERYIFKKIIL